MIMERQFSLFALLMLVVAGGCDDAEEDPFGSVVAEESLGALSLQTRLPAPDEWAVDYAADSLTGLDVWTASWELRADEGRGAREAVYAVLVPALERLLPAREIESGLDQLRLALDEAEALPANELPERINRRLALARDAQLRGGLALERGDSLRALEELVRGLDILQEVEPQQVAHELIAAAQEGMRRLLGSDSYSEQTRERAQSLIRIARVAARDGDFTRAIQSAYYATRLLDVDVD